MISVVVIGKNEGERLSACLESISSALHVLSHEVIYVDSRSTDDSLERAKALKARCFVVEEEHPTAGLGRLIGAREARGEFLLFLDGDMRLLPGFAEKALMTIAQTDAVGVCGIRRDIYLKDGQEAGRNDNYFGCTQQRLCPEFGGALFISAEALKTCGGWSGDTIACEEAELHARLKDAGLKIVEIPVPMIEHLDSVRDNRGLWGVIFSRRRLGEGQAFRCAMKQKKAGAYVRHEQLKFVFFALDLLAVLLAFLLPGLGAVFLCMLESMQLGYLMVKGCPRAFVSQKLFFFAFPAGLCTYRVRSRSYQSY